MGWPYLHAVTGPNLSRHFTFSVRNGGGRESMNQLCCSVAGPTIVWCDGARLQTDQPVFILNDVKERLILMGLTLTLSGAAVTAVSGWPLVQPKQLVSQGTRIRHTDPSLGEAPGGGLGRAGLGLRRETGSGLWRRISGSDGASVNMPKSTSPWCVGNAAYVNQACFTNMDISY